MRRRTDRAARLAMAGALAALAAAAAGCTDPAGPHAAVARDLAEARATWAAAGHGAYEFEMAWICFCPPELLAPSRVRVDGGVVVQVTRLEDGVDVPSDELDAWRSVEGLFALVEGAIEDGAYSLTAEFDPATGLPRDVRIDYQRTIVDEELGFTAGALRDLR